MGKQKGQIQIEMCGDIGNLLIATLNNVILSPDLCNGIFSIIKLMNLRYTCSFHKGFITVYSGNKK